MSEVSFPLKDLTRKTQTVLTILGLTISTATTLFLVLFSIITGITSGVAAFYSSTTFLTTSGFAISQTLNLMEIFFVALVLIVLLPPIRNFTHTKSIQSKTNRGHVPNLPTWNHLWCRKKHPLKIRFHIQSCVSNFGSQKICHPSSNPLHYLSLNFNNGYDSWRNRLPTEPAQATPKEP